MNVTFDTLYQELVPHVEGVIRDESERFHRALGVDRDDAEQEARIALLMSLPHYDYAKSRGGIKAYARRVIRNAMCGLMYAATAQMRAPHVVVTSPDGSERLLRYSVESMESHPLLDPPDEGCPESEYLHAEADERIRLLRLRLMMSLSGRERDVFECQSQPSEAFLIYMRNRGIESPTIDAIGGFLGLNKNEIDWSVHKIKRLFTIILEESEYIDIIEASMRDGRWPMVYKSDMAADVLFIQTLIDARQLDARPCAAVDATSDGDIHRIIEHYEWGSIVHLRLDDERQATLLLEGRFNHRTGEVIGVAGHWKQVSDYLPWYGELNKALAKRKHTAEVQDG